MELPIPNNADLQSHLRLFDGPQAGYKFVGPIMTKYNLPKYRPRKYPKVMPQFHTLDVRDVFENHRNIIFIQYLNPSSNRLDDLRGRLIGNFKKGITSGPTTLKFLNTKFTKEYLQSQPKLHSLINLFDGPVLSAVSNETDFANLKNDFDILSSFQEGLILGAKFGDEIYTANSLPILFKMPKKTEIYSQIAGILSAPALNLARTLETPATNLVLSLDQLSKSTEE